MNTTEIVVLVLLVILYIGIGEFARSVAYNNIDTYPGDMFRGEKIVYVPNYRFVVRNSRLLSIVCGLLWVFLLAFNKGRELGEWIYDDLIIKGNEEDRIAPWVV